MFEEIINAYPYGQSNVKLAIKGKEPDDRLDGKIFQCLVYWESPKGVSNEFYLGDVWFTAMADGDAKSKINQVINQVKEWHKNEFGESPETKVVGTSLGIS